MAKPRPFHGPLARSASVSRTHLSVCLVDGRTLVVPIQSLQGLADAPDSARRVVELLGGGIGIRFPLCDEDFSVAGLLQPELTMRFRRPPVRRRRWPLDPTPLAVRRSGR